MMGHSGSIVLISSCAANVGLPNHEAIAAAKSGIEKEWSGLLPQLILGIKSE